MAERNEKAPTRQTSRPGTTNVPAETPQKSTAHLRVLQGDEDDIVDVEGFKPLLPEGHWFEAKFTGHSTAIIFAASKVFWEFTVVEPGEWNEQKLFRPFRVRRVIGRPGPKGKFVLHASGEMYSNLVRLLDVRQRADRITLAPLRHMLFRVKTRTVRTNHRQQPIPEQVQYSVISEIERGE